jgi:transcriptional regulator with GAF, ATPase, and Fis domain
MLTSHDAAGDRYWGLKTGADAYLTKDFDARMLLDAVRDTVASAANRPAAPPADPIAYMSDSEILGRVSDMLDRKLYEATLVNEINGLAAMLGDYRETAASLLAVLATFIDFTMASIGLVDEGDVGIRVNHSVSHEDFERLAAHVVDNLSAYSSRPLDFATARLWAADPYGRLGGESGGDPLTTFVAMPLRAQGRVIGLLALGSASAHAFSEKELAVLRVIESAAAVVVDNARLYDRAKVV